LSKGYLQFEHAFGVFGSEFHERRFTFNGVYKAATIIHEGHVCHSSTSPTI